jgi:hypothetical protein
MIHLLSEMVRRQSTRRLHDSPKAKRSRTTFAGYARTRTGEADGEMYVADRRGSIALSGASVRSVRDVSLDRGERAPEAQRGDGLRVSSASFIGCGQRRRDLVGPWLSWIGAPGRGAYDFVGR